MDRVLLLDLSEQDLRLRVVNPYKDGKDIYDRGSITRVADIARIVILESEKSAEDLLKKIASDHQAELERIKREQGLNVLGSYCGRQPEELVGYCPDVTDQWFGEAPGAGSEWTKIIRFFHNPWVMKVSILLIGVIIGKLWGSV